MLGASRNSLAAAQARLHALAEPAGAVDLAGLSVDLFAVTDLLVDELPLRRTLADPSTPGEAKANLVGALLRERVSAPTLSFLVELVRSRWSRPRDLVDALEALAVVAAFQQALAEGTLDEVEEQLFSFARIVEREPALREALGDDSATPERKRALLSGLLADKVGAVALRVITAAAVGAVRNRTLDEALEAFSQLAAELRDRLNARVTVAVAPDAAQLEQLTQELTRLYGKPMGLRVEVDPSILGGVVVRVADEILDASVARRLDAARRDLTARL